MPHRLVCDEPVELKPQLCELLLHPPGAPYNT
jgi:hypothetical protein